MCWVVAGGSEETLSINAPERKEGKKGGRKEGRKEVRRKEKTEERRKKGP